MAKAKLWIQKSHRGCKEGALHKQLGVPQDETIPVKLLRDIKKTEVGKYTHGRKVTRLLKSRTVWALNVRKKK